MIIGGALLGICSALSKKKRIEELKELEWVISSLEAEIRYHHSILYEACANVSRRFGQPFSEWLAIIGNGLINKDCDNSFFKIWDESLVYLYEKSHMKKSDIEEIREVGRTLGYLDIIAQERGMELEKERIHNLIMNEYGELVGKMRVSIVLGSMGGILLVVLLI